MADQFRGCQCSFIRRCERKGEGTRGQLCGRQRSQLHVRCLHSHAGTPSPVNASARLPIHSDASPVEDELRRLFMHRLFARQLLALCPLSALVSAFRPGRRSNILHLTAQAPSSTWVSSASQTPSCYTRPLWTDTACQISFAQIGDSHKSTLLPHAIIVHSAAHSRRLECSFNL